MEISIKKFSRIVFLFMIAVSVIYFIAAYFESAEFNTEISAPLETMLFTTSGILYVPVGVWMLKNGFNSRAPYIIAILGSVSLIGLYVASRTVTLPVVGMHPHFGVLDISSKIMQVAVIIISLVLIPKLKKAQISLSSG